MLRHLPKTRCGSIRASFGKLLALAYFGQVDRRFCVSWTVVTVVCEISWRSPNQLACRGRVPLAATVKFWLCTAICLCCRY